MADSRITAYSSIRNNVLNNGGAAPLQGFDVGIWVYDIGRKRNVLAGQFTTALVTVRIGTEPYMAANERQATLLDGEIAIGVDLEKGMISADVLTETFGFKHITREHRYLRSPRFNITFALDPVDWTALDEPLMAFDTFIKRYPSGYMMLTDVKMSDLMIAAAAGKPVVANKWRGQAEGILCEVNTYSDLLAKYPDRTRREFDAQGQPIDIDKVRTHHYVGYADQASAYAPIFEPSRPDDSLFGLLASALTYSQLLAERQRLMLISHIPGVAEAIKTINDLIQSVFGGDRNVTPSYALPIDPMDAGPALNTSYAENSPPNNVSAVAWVVSEMARAREEAKDPNRSASDRRDKLAHLAKLGQILDTLQNGEFQHSESDGVMVQMVDGRPSFSVPLDPRGEQVIQSVRASLARQNAPTAQSRASDQPDKTARDIVRDPSYKELDPTAQPPEEQSY